MTIKIIGAGMAGLIAANLLRRHDPVILEEQQSLPNNHSAVLRFRSSVVGDALGIEFKKVLLLKDVESTGNIVRDAHLYSWKVGGIFRSDRSVTRGTEIAERWIAPPDLIERMAHGLDIRFGERWSWREGDGRVISTIPMPVMMDLTGYPSKPRFESRVGYNIIGRVDRAESYSSLLVPDPVHAFSRISVTGREMIIEVPNLAEEPDEEEVIDMVEDACNLVGLPSASFDLNAVKRQDYAKIMPIDERERQTFLHWLNGIKGIAYSLGRFACWRPGLMNDDLIKDVRTIEKWMRQGEAAGFEQDLQRARKS